jgi:alpha-glucosidase (family GH31 glycosyl hydrolase)
MPPSINDVMSLGDLASWMKAYDWCSFQFDDKAFPDPASYLRTVKDKYNVKVCVWINPYICESARVIRGLSGQGWHN